MKKIITTLFIISFFIFSTGYSQSNSCKKGHCLKGDVGYMNFTIGPSIPTGDFADNNVNNPNAGYAKAGSNLGLNAGFNVYDRVNITGSLFFSSNGYDETVLKQKLTYEYPGTTWETSGRSWDIYGFMIGAAYSYPFRNKFTGDVRILTGIMHSSLPEMIVTSNTGMKITEGNQSASSFVYQISVGGHYPLGRLLDLTGSLDYLSSSPTFNNISRTSSTPGSVNNTSTVSYNHNINIISLNAGFRVKF